MSTAPPEGGSRRPRSVLRRALLRFAVSGAVALVLVGIATAVVADSVARDMAVRHAKSRGTSFARVVSAPLVDEGVESGQRQPLDDFGEVMRNRLQDRSMVHIKVWDRAGRVIWSDESRLVGRVIELEPAVAGLFGSGETLASMSDLDKEENVEEGHEGPLLEVYVPTRSAAGTPIIVESYWSTDHIDNDATAIMRKLAPLAIGALLLFAAAIFPLAWSLARRVDHAQAESSKMLAHALSASDLERRRIVHDLHDGVMQDLSGAGYALSAFVDSMPEEDQESRRFLRDLNSLLKRVGLSLRSMLSDLYPANLARDGLAAAVEDLADRSAEAGVQVTVDVAGVGEASTEATQLTYRVIREGLRNVVRHARAQRAEVRVTRVGSQLLVVVSDDGRGVEQAPPEGHLGLRLLADTLRDVGGSFDVARGPERGTVLSARLPMALSAR